MGSLQTRTKMCPPEDGRSGSSMPEANGTPVLEANCTPLPETDSTSIPEPNGIPVSEASSTPLPETDGIPIPEANGTLILEASSTPLPETSGPSIPKPSGTQPNGTETNGTETNGMSASPGPAGRRRIVIVGFGMVATAFAEKILKLDRACSITIIGEEPHIAYNRVGLTS